MKPLLIPYDLDRHRLARAMISAVQYLTEGSFAKSVNNLITVRKMIPEDNKVVATLIVISVVVSGVLQSGGLLVALSTNEVDRWVFEDFLAFIFGEVIHLVTFQDGYAKLSATNYSKRCRITHKHTSFDGAIIGCIDVMAAR